MSIRYCVDKHGIIRRVVSVKPFTVIHRSRPLTIPAHDVRRFELFPVGWDLDRCKAFIG